jgi:glycosyltransferase involved in cell wall biosynthesis
MSQPSISVVIPTYNRAETVAAAIASALDQRDVPDEVIVVDDGSSDATGDVLAGFGERIIAIHQANSGVSGARNAAMRRATGTWIAFLDSDDVWYPDRIAILRRDVGATDAGVHVANVAITSASYRHDMFALNNFHFPDDATRKYACGLEPLLHYPFTSGVAVRRAWVERSGAFDPSLSIFEDFDFLTRMCFLGPWLASPVALAEIRRQGDPGAALSRLRVSDPVGACAAMVRSFERLLAHPSLSGPERNLVRRRLSHYRFEMAGGLAGTGQTLAAYRSLIRSARDHPTLKGWLRAAPALVLGHAGYRLIAGRGKGFHRSSADQGTPGPKIKEGIADRIRSKTPP